MKMPSLLKTLSLSCILPALSLLPSNASAQCYKAAVQVVSGVTNNQKPKIVKAAVGGVVYTLINGVTSIQSGSTVGFASSKGKAVQIKSSGSATGLTVNGDITTTPKDVVISGVIQYPTKTASVPALLTVSATGIKVTTTKKRNGRTLSQLTGKTAVQIVDVATGAVLYKQRPLPFSKVRGFSYRWEAISCSIGTPGVKR